MRFAVNVTMKDIRKILIMYLPRKMVPWDNGTGSPGRNSMLAAKGGRLLVVRSSWVCSLREPVVGRGDGTEGRNG